MRCTTEQRRSQLTGALSQVKPGLCKCLKRADLIDGWQGLKRSLKEPSKDKKLTLFSIQTAYPAKSRIRFPELFPVSNHHVKALIAAHPKEKLFFLALLVSQSR
jgi:hypothetical protein